MTQGPATRQLHLLQLLNIHQQRINGCPRARMIYSTYDEHVKLPFRYRHIF